MTQTVSPEAPVMLTSVTEVRRYVEALAVLVEQGDYTTATELEHNIWAGVLEAVASSNAQAGWIATEALKTSKIAFPRS